MSNAKSVFLAAMAVHFDSVTALLEPLTPGDRVTFDSVESATGEVSVADAVLAAHVEATPDRFVMTRLGRSPGVSVGETEEARATRVKAAKKAAREESAREQAAKDARLAELEAKAAEVQAA